MIRFTYWYFAIPKSLILKLDVITNKNSNSNSNSSNTVYYYMSFEFSFFSKIYQDLCSLPIDITLYFPSKLQQHNDYFDYNNSMSTLWVRFHGRESRGECRMNNLDPPEFKKMFKIMEKSF